MFTPLKLNVFFKLFLMYLTYDEGMSLGYEQKIIKRGGKTSTCEIYFNEFFFPLTIGAGCFSEINLNHLFKSEVEILLRELS